MTTLKIITPVAVFETQHETSDAAYCAAVAALADLQAQGVKRVTVSMIGE